MLLVEVLHFEHGLLFKCGIKPRFNFKILVSVIHFIKRIEQSGSSLFLIYKKKAGWITTRVYIGCKQL